MNSRARRIRHPTTDQAMIELGMRPVCDALNALPGVDTLWSCEGHPDGLHDPYVVFLAPQSLSFRLNQLLAYGHGIDDSLKFCWAMTANFREEGDLQWTIRTGRPQRPSLLLRHRWRNALDAELARLAVLLARAGV